MNATDLERLNTLADKALNKKVTVDELREFNQILTHLEDPSELDLADTSLSQNYRLKGMLSDS